VIWNLVVNAIKFTPSGGRVDVQLSHSAGRVLFQVSDTGEGIRADFIPHLFERFRQAEAASTRKHGGLGLGLSIVRHLVEMHGGTVSASSHGPGQGSVFTVSLPAAQVEEVAPAAVRESQPEQRPPGAIPSTPPRLDKLHIVVVEDQPDTLTFLAQLLEKLGAQVTAVPSAREGLQALRAHPPDVLISDIGMPEIDGYGFIEQVRALPPDQGGQIPAVALTAFARTEDRVRALQAGFSTHVPKPVEPAELAAVIRSLVPAKRAEAKRPRRKKA
jgi:CheY-like chemotaxis protein